MIGEVNSPASDRAKALRKLHSASGRRKAGQFLVEGLQAVSVAMELGAVTELYVTEDCLQRDPRLQAFVRTHRRWWMCSTGALAAMAETDSPQGVVAVCDALPEPTVPLLPQSPGFSALMVQTREPGNAGTAIRTADAAGALGIGFTTESVDVLNGKAIRASVGSLFQIPVHTQVCVVDVIDEAKRSGVSVLATSGYADVSLDVLQDQAAVGDGPLLDRVLWLFGNEAAGLAPEVAALADYKVAIPLYGKVESLNLGTAVAVALYANARAQHHISR